MRATPIPYAKLPPNGAQRMGKLDSHLLGTAMTILEQAVARSHHQAAATLDVRLALMVVHRYAREGRLVARFWERASITNRTVNETLHEPLDAIRHRLTSLGWLQPPVDIPPARFWPWQSPAPPGWRVGPGGARQADPVEKLDQNGGE